MSAPSITSWMEQGQPPPGWNYNPSAWSERLGVLGLALTGLGIAIYLGLYQLGVLSSVWEPFFGDGSRVILKESFIARLLPVPDALIGAFVYLLDSVFAVIGGRERWRTHPWAVLVQGVLTVALAVAGVLLTICQGLFYDIYCSFCLCSAACSVLMVGFALAEVLAALQHLRGVQRRHGSWWHALWGRAD